MMLTSRLRPLLSPKMGGIAPLVIASLAFAFSAQSVRANLVQDIERQFPSGDTIANIDSGPFDTAVAAAIAKNKAFAAQYVTTALNLWAANNKSPDKDSIAPNLVTAAITASGTTANRLAALSAITAAAINDITDKTATTSSIAQTVFRTFPITTGSSTDFAFGRGVTAGIRDLTSLQTFTHDLVATAQTPTGVASTSAFAIKLAAPYTNPLAFSPTRVGAIVAGAASTGGDDKGKANIAGAAVTAFKKYGVDAYTIALFSTPTASDPVAFASALAGTQNISVFLKAQIAKGAVQASAGTESTVKSIAANLAGAMFTSDPAYIATFTAIEIGGVNTNGTLVSDIVFASANTTGDQNQTAKAAIASSAISAVPPRSRAAIVPTIVSQLVTQISTSSDITAQAGFAQLLAKKQPVYASQIALGTAIANPSVISNIAGEVAAANGATILRSAAIAGTLAGAANMEAAEDIAFGIGEQFKPTSPLTAQAPLIARAIAAKVINQVGIYNLGTSENEIAAVASVLANAIPNNISTKVGLVASIAVRVIAVNNATKTYPDLAAFGSYIVGTIATTIQQSNQSANLTAFFRNLQNDLLVALPGPAFKALRLDIQAALAAVKGTNNPYKSANDPTFIHDETPVVNG